MPDRIPNDDPQARWLIRQALIPWRGPREAHRSSRTLIYTMPVPDDLKRRAWRLVQADFFEGFCPIHRTPLEVGRHKDRVRAYCGDCGLWWGRPAEESAA